MHIAPELLKERAKNLKFPFDTSVAADIYALGCVANQIYFRQPLSDEDSTKDSQNNSGSFFGALFSIFTSKKYIGRIYH
jgi:hypothetical protein